MKATKWSNFETSKQLFWYIPKPINIDGNITNENVNSYFELIYMLLIFVSFLKWVSRKIYTRYLLPINAYFS